MTRQHLQRQRAGRPRSRVAGAGWPSRARAQCRSSPWSGGREAPSTWGRTRGYTRLAALRQIDLGGEQGPEHVALGPDGRLYAAVASGAILRLQPDGARLERWVETGGRTLGFAFDASGVATDRGPTRCAACWPSRGAAGSRPRDRDPRRPGGRPADPLRRRGGGGPQRAHPVHRRLAPPGPRRWGGTFEASLLDILEHRAPARARLEDRSSTRRVRTLVRDLCFANGLALSADESSLFVADGSEP